MFFFFTSFCRYSHAALKKKKKDAIRCSNIGILQETSLTRNFDLNVMSLSSRWLFMGGGNKT